MGHRRGPLVRSRGGPLPHGQVRPSRATLSPGGGLRPPSGTSPQDRIAAAKPPLERRSSMAMTPTERASLIERYANGPKRLREALQAVPTDAMQWRPKPGEWSAHEVVVHCADSETQAASRI